MKIALIHPSVSSAAGDAERVIALQIRLLRQSGHCVSLACFDKTPNREADCFIPLSREASRKSLVLYLEAALAGSDAVIFHHLGTLPFAPELTAALRDLPRRLPSARWICWVHQVSCMDSSYLPFGSQEIAYWMSTPCADWEYVAGNFLSAEHLQIAFGVTPSVVHSGIDCAETLELPPALASWATASRLWDADFILHHPSPFQPRRGIETSLQILRKLQASSLRVFLLVGRPFEEIGNATTDYAQQLRHLRISLGLEESCVFLGEHFPATREMLSACQRIADAILLPCPVPDPESVFREAALFSTPVFHPEASRHKATLMDLGNGFAYPASASASQIADFLIRQTESRDAIQARRLARAQHCWPDTYQKSLASFLEKLHN